jgi:ferritin-like metal-binding protein YciE
MKLTNLEDLFVQELKDLYSAENQITKALPRMAKAASSPELKNAFQEHLEVTRNQVQRLEQIFQDLGVNPRGKKCVGMEGLIEEGKELLENDADEAVIDAGLLAAAQKVEHYEMAAYGTVCAFAKLLGNDDAADLLSQTLEEEKETDLRLSQIAEQSVNVQAANGNDEEDEEDED